MRLWKLRQNLIVSDVIFVYFKEIQHTNPVLFLSSCSWVYWGGGGNHQGTLSFSDISVAQNCEGFSLVLSPWRFFSCAFEWGIKVLEIVRVKSLKISFQCTWCNMVNSQLRIKVFLKINFLSCIFRRKSFSRGFFKQLSFFWITELLISNLFEKGKHYYFA